MVRFLLPAALLLTAGVAVAQPPDTQPPAAYYVATPVGAVSKAQLMTHSTPWRLVDGAYVANRAPERDLIVCQLVVRDAGPLQSFAVAGRPIDADALAKCNSRAK